MNDIRPASLIGHFPATQPRSDSPAVEFVVPATPRTMPAPPARSNTPARDDSAPRSNAAEARRPEAPTPERKTERAPESKRADRPAERARDDADQDNPASDSDAPRPADNAAAPAAARNAQGDKKKDDEVTADGAVPAAAAILAEVRAVPAASPAVVTAAASAAATASDGVAASAAAPALAAAAGKLPAALANAETPKTTAAAEVDAKATSSAAATDDKAAKPEAQPLDPAALVADPKTADAGRDVARDRLLEDFERRFERSLAAAAGAPARGHETGPAVPLNMPTSAGPITTTQATISTPVGQPQFAADFNHRVLLFASQRIQSAEIAVTPADLGPVSVSIEVRGQEASLAFNAPHAATRAAIEDALPRLREMLAGQGLQLTNASVGDQTRRDTAQSNRDGSRDSNRASERGGIEGVQAASGGVVTDAQPAARSVRLIDIRV